MRIPSLATLGLALVALVAPLRAAAADHVSVELIGKALAGVSRPGLVLHANKAVVAAQARLKRAGGESLTLKAGRIGPGEKKELLFDAPAGRHSYSGTLAVEFIDGSSGEMPLTFEIFVSEGVKVAVLEQKLDLAGGKLGFTFTGEADKCEYDVIYDGKQPRHGWVRFAGEAPGSELEISWPAAEAQVLRIQLTCHDREGF